MFYAVLLIHRKRSPFPHRGRLAVSDAFIVRRLVAVALCFGRVAEDVDPHKFQKYLRTPFF